MVRSLLEDRFQLKFHAESRELPVYNLVVVKDGFEVKAVRDQSPPDSRPGPSASAGVRRDVQRNQTRPGSYGMPSNSCMSTLEGAAVRLSALVSMLQIQTGRYVIDKTDNALAVTVPECQQQARPTIFSALSEQNWNPRTGRVRW